MASGHSPLAPLPLRQDKNKICSLRKSVPTAVGKKEKHTSYNTAYLVTAFIQKPPPIFASATLRQTSDMPKRCAKSLRPTLTLRCSRFCTTRAGKPSLRSPLAPLRVAERHRTTRDMRNVRQKTPLRSVFFRPLRISRARYLKLVA